MYKESARLLAYASSTQASYQANLAERYVVTCTDLVNGSRAVPFRDVRKRGVIKFGIDLPTMPPNHMWPDGLHRQHAQHDQYWITGETRHLIAAEARD